jgi:hypothetical protein
LTSQAACSAGYFSANSAVVSPDRTPTSYSRSRASYRTGTPATAATISAVSRARERSLDQMTAGFMSARYGAAARAWARPVSSSEMSA